MIRHIVESQPQIWETDTRYNKRDAKNFRFLGLSPPVKEVKIGFEYRVRKYERNPFGGGTYQIFGQSWDVEVASKYYVEDKKVKAQVAVTKADSDWASGILGWLANIYEGLFMVLGFIVTGGPVAKLSDALVLVAANTVVGIATYRGDIDQTFAELNSLNDNDVLYLVDVRFDDKGIWHTFKYDVSNYDQVVDFIRRNQILPI